MSEPDLGAEVPLTTNLPPERPTQSTGYTVVLPPGWIRLDARSPRGTTELDTALDDALSGLPQDRFGPLVSQARKQAHAMLAQARTAGVHDLYLPLAGMHGTAIPASFAVRTMTLPPPPAALRRPDDTDQEALRIALGLAERLPAGELRSLTAGVAVRSRQRGADTDQVVPGLSRATTRVDYHWPLPGESLHWAVASFTTADMEAPEVTELLVELFDAVMTTWRWRPGFEL